MPTLAEVLIQNLNIFLQNSIVGTQQLTSILMASLSQYLSIILGALDAILPPN